MPKKHRTVPSFSVESPKDRRNSRRISLPEERYISFCFKDNGTFYVVKDQNTNHTHVECSTTRARHKLKYDDDLKIIKEDEVQYQSSYNENESYNEDEETIYYDPESPVSGTNEDEESSAENDIHPEISQESSGSNDSTSSFAFPVLNSVWSGSPIKMPRTRTTGVHLRKHKDWRVVFHCCRF